MYRRCQEFPICESKDMMKENQTIEKDQKSLFVNMLNMEL